MFHPNGTMRIIFVDGDAFEPGNAERQLFPTHLEGKNKARAVASHLGHPNVLCHPEYVSGEEVLGILDRIPKPGNVLLVTAVDNDATRRSIIEALAQSNHNHIIINPGNTETTSMVSTFGRIKGRWVGNDPLQTYDNLRNIKDRIPGRCSAEVPTAPQLLVANAAASFSTLIILWNILEGRNPADEVHTNTEKGQVVSTKIPVLIHS